MCGKKGKFGCSLPPQQQLLLLPETLYPIHTPLHTYTPSSPLHPIPRDPPLPTPCTPIPQKHPLYILPTQPLAPLYPVHPPYNPLPFKLP